MAPAVQEQPKVQAPKMRFVVLAGKHHEGIPSLGTAKVYRRGDVVETSEDLVKAFGKDKFRRLRDGEANPIEKPSSPLEMDLKSKSVSELKGIAADYEIDLGDARSKAEIIDVILEASQADETL